MLNYQTPAAFFQNGSYECGLSGNWPQGLTLVGLREDKRSRAEVVRLFEDIRAGAALIWLEVNLLKPTWILPSGHDVGQIGPTRARPLSLAGRLCLCLEIPAIRAIFWTLCVTATTLCFWEPAAMCCSTRQVNIWTGQPKT